MQGLSHVCSPISGAAVGRWGVDARCWYSHVHRHRRGCSSHLLLQKQAGPSIGKQHRSSSPQAADQCIRTDKSWSCLLIHSASSLSLAIMEMREWPFPEVSVGIEDGCMALGGARAVQGAEAVLQHWFEGFLWVKVGRKHLYCKSPLPCIDTYTYHPCCRFISFVIISTYCVCVCVCFDLNKRFTFTSTMFGPELLFSLVWTTIAEVTNWSHFGPDQRGGLSWDCLLCKIPV